MKKRILFAWLVGAIALSLACFGGCDKGGVQSGSSQGGASQGSSDSASEDVYADYTVEHYFEDLFGGFDVDEALTETSSEKVGTTVSATTKDASKEYAMVNPMSTNNCLVMPSVNTIGKNTHTVVNVDAKIAPATSPAPSIAASLAE